MPDLIPLTVVHIPHALQVVPEDVRASFVLGPDALAAELLRMTDAFTDELFSLSSDTATSIVFPVSRLVVDPERFIDDVQEPMTAKGMGVVYTRTSDGKRLRPDSFPSQRREELLKAYYVPHHNRLSRAVAAAIEQHGKCLLIDGHSFSSNPYPHEYNQSPNRPDICIGTDDFHTPSWLTELAVALFREQGFSVDVDRPFAGTIVPEPFFQCNSNVLSVMIEINRSLYMYEESGQRLSNFSVFAATIHNTLTQLIAKASDGRTWP
jgi:N-formylglutamate amidohydrolase